jgi:hypothetical protein
MDVRLMPVVEAARELGKDPSGIRKRLQPDHPHPLLSDESRKHVVMVDGTPVATLADLISTLHSRVAAHEATQARLSAAEDEIALLKMELGDSGTRVNAEVQALSEALEAAGTAQAAMARALRERLSRA